VQALLTKAKKALPERKSRRLPKSSILESQPLSFGVLMRKIPGQPTFNPLNMRSTIATLAVSFNRIVLFKSIQSP